MKRTATGVMSVTGESGRCGLLPGTFVVISGGSRKSGVVSDRATGGVDVGAIPSELAAEPLPP